MAEEFAKYLRKKERVNWIKIIKLSMVVVLILIFSIIVISATLLTFTPDAKITKIYTEKICEAELLLSKETKLCNKDTPSEIDVNFDKDSKTEIIEINYEGVSRSVLTPSPKI